MRQDGAIQLIARYISIIGHPAVLVPGAISLRLIGSSASVQFIQLSIGVTIVIVAGVMLFSLLQVCKGSWSHVDASVKSERHQLNLILVLVLIGAGLGGAWLGQPEVLTLGLVTVGGMIALTSILQRWFKISLHTSFAMFASLLLWPMWPLVLGGVVVSIAVGWSRLILSRHSVIEVMLGAVIGALTGVLLTQAVDSQVFS